MNESNTFIFIVLGDVFNRNPMFLSQPSINDTFIKMNAAYRKLVSIVIHTMIFTD